MKYINQPDVRITVTLPGSGPVDITLSYPLRQDHETLLRQLHEGGVDPGVIECRMHDDDLSLKDLRDDTGRVRGAWLYLRRHGDRLLLCHWPNSGMGGPHAVPTPMTAEHRKGQEYIALRGEANGYTVELEKSLAAGTRSDVVVRGSHLMAAEVQVSGVSVATVMRRTRAATNAGACTTWFAGVEDQPAWTWKVPTVLTNSIAGLDPNTWHVGSGPRVLEWEKCGPSSRFNRCPDRRSNFCGKWHPLWRPMHGLTVDDIVEKVPGGGLVRLDTGTKQGTLLTTPEDKKRWDEHALSPTRPVPTRQVVPGLNHSAYSSEKLRERIRAGEPSPVQPDQIPKQSRQLLDVQPDHGDRGLYSNKARFHPGGQVVRIADIDGHLWPVTGYECKVCGFPIIPCFANQAYHPECDPDAPGWSESQILQWTRVREHRLQVEKGRELSESLLRRGKR